MKTAQINLVREKLLKSKSVSILWAIYDKHILRLGAIIHRLRNEGMNIETDYLVKKDGTKGRTCIYRLR